MLKRKTHYVLSGRRLPFAPLTQLQRLLRGFTPDKHINVYISDRSEYVHVDVSNEALGMHPGDLSQIISSYS